MYASAVSAIQGVRDFLMEMQRSLAREHSVIMDGRDIGENPNRDMANILAGLVHRSMVPVLLRRLALPEGKKANSLTKEQRRALVQELKHFTVTLTGPRPVAEAIVTAGGVKVGEVVPGTMASKLVEGLYFAGEILDVDAYTGGFNLQIAWATGYLAGLSAAEK